MYFEGVHHRQFRGLIYGGCFVTVITRSLGVDLIHLGEGLRPVTFGRANLLPMQVLHQFGPDQWRLVSHPDDQVPFVPEPIPDVDAIPPYQEVSHGVPDPAFPLQQPRHPAHPIVAQPEVQPPQPEVEQPHQIPQHPQHVYADMTPGHRAFARRVERRLARLERRSEERDQRIDWIIQSQLQFAQRMGFGLPPPPEFQPDDDDDDDDDAA